MDPIEPTGKTARELDEERNAIGNCTHPASAVVMDDHAVGEARRYCNCCDRYID